MEIVLLGLFNSMKFVAVQLLQVDRQNYTTPNELGKVMGFTSGLLVSIIMANFRLLLVFNHYRCVDQP